MLYCIHNKLTIDKLSDIVLKVHLPCTKSNLLEWHNLEVVSVALCHWHSQTFYMHTMSHVHSFDCIPDAYPMASPHSSRSCSSSYFWCLTLLVGATSYRLCIAEHSQHIHCPIGGLSAWVWEIRLWQRGKAWKKGWDHIPLQEPVKLHYLLETV